MDEKVMEMLAKILVGQNELKDELNEAIANISETLNRVEVKLDVLQLETAHIRRIK